MGQYDSSLASARRLLAKFGQTVILRHESGAYDPATSGVAVTTTDAEVGGAIFSIGPGVTTIRGLMVQSDDQQMYLEPGESEPVVGDKVIVGSTQYKVLSVDRLAPGGVVVLYTLHLRK